MCGPRIGAVSIQFGDEDVSTPRTGKCGAAKGGCFSEISSKDRAAITQRADAIACVRGGDTSLCGPCIGAFSIQFGNEDVMVSRAGQCGAAKGGCVLERSCDEGAAITQRADAIADVRGGANGTSSYRTTMKSSGQPAQASAKDGAESDSSKE